jgi:2-polyprenyl-3-methyl-5-hydroxy-6-metoxy-1,4-benzoquinol methylase
MNPISAAERFERIYADSPDPWGYHESDYEQQKYAATLAALPAAPVDRCLEVGCSIGVFTKLLAERCGTVVAVDFSQRAVTLAGSYLRAVDNVEVRQAAFPEQTPPGEWDVIICSEVLYYLEEPRFAQAMNWLAQQLRRGACLVAVSWRGGHGDEPLRGDEVHDRLTAAFAANHTLDARHSGYRLDRFGPTRASNGNE